MPTFLLFGAAASTAVTANAGLSRGRPFAYFAGVVTGLHALSAAAVASVLPRGPLTWAFAAANAAVYTHFFLLARPRWKPRWYRALVSVPAHYTSATTLLALPFVGATALGAPRATLALPLLAGAVGLLDSLRAPREVHRVVLDGRDVGPLRRMGPSRASSHVDTKTADAGALRVVQITDPHLGPFMSVARLRGIVARAAALEPDLVLLTGDFLTMESQSDPSLLAEALAPLGPLAGKTFACMGNHDHEAPETVREALARVGVTLLIDAMQTVETRRGPVEILGLDFRFRGRAEHLARVCREFPRRAGIRRLALLHDPGAFAHMPEGAADLVFAGHTHGGQVGLVRLGLPHTVVSALSRVPDHGLWGRGAGRLYVHRGTGQYGFPLRVGVPAEESLVLVEGIDSAEIPA